MHTCEDSLPSILRIGGMALAILSRIPGGVGIMFFDRRQLYVSVAVLALFEIVTAVIVYASR
jgi:hypothetical protein